jgi:hypothetical protein
MESGQYYVTVSCFLLLRTSDLFQCCSRGQEDMVTESYRVGITVGGGGLGDGYWQLGLPSLGMNMKK